MAAPFTTGQSYVGGTDVLGTLNQGISGAGGIASGEAFGTPGVTSQVTVFPVGITSGEALGVPKLDQRIFVTSVPSAEAFGTPTVQPGAVTIYPTGIPSAEAFGVPKLTMLILPVGIATEEAFGNAKINLTISPTGIASVEAFGVPTVQPGSVTISPTGIPSLEAFGVPTVIPTDVGRQRPEKHLRLIHEISTNEGTDLPTIDSWEANEEAPGGFTTASGRVPRTVVENHPRVYQYGATWKTYDMASGKVVFAGRLLDPEETTDGYTLSAKGWATIADREVQRLLYQTRSLDEWHASDQDPFNFKASQKHGTFNGSTFSDVVGSSTVTGQDNHNRQLNNPGDVVQHDWPVTADVTNMVKVYAQRRDPGSGGSPPDKAIVQTYVWDSTANQIVSYNGDQKTARRELTGTSEDQIAGLSFVPPVTSATRYKIRVKYLDKYNPIVTSMHYGTTKTINSGKIDANVRGKSLVFKVAKHTHFHGGEGSGLVFWAFEQPLRRIAFDLDKDLNTDSYKLELAIAVGPDGALNEVQSWSLDSDGPTSIDFTLPRDKTDYDMIFLRLSRKDGHVNKSSRKYRLSISNIRVNAIAKGDDYTTSDVVRDISARLDLHKREIEDEDTDVLPLDVTSSTFADALNTVALLDDDRWLILDRGNGPVMDYGAWDKRVWRVNDSQAQVDLVPIPRFNVVRVPFRGPGGVEDIAEVKAVPSPFPPGIFEYFDVPLDDPLPPEDAARAFGQRVVDYFSESRAAGSARITRVEDDDGRSTFAHFMHAGDVVEVPGYRGRRLRIKSLRRTEDVVELNFDDGHALLDKWLAQRRRLLAMGRPSADATWAETSEAKPDVPQNVALTFTVREHKQHAEFRAIVNWDDVTNDIQGTELNVDRYQVHLMPTNAAGDKQANGQVHKKTAHAKESGDAADTDDPPTRAVFPNVEHPRTWYYKARVRAIDNRGRRSEWTDWTTPVQPVDALVAPPQVTGVALSFDTQERHRHVRNRAVIKWDEVGTWAMGDDNEADVGHYKVVLQHTTSGGSPINDSGGDPVERHRNVEARDGDADTRAKTSIWGIKKNHYYRAKVRAIDRFNHRGPWSAWTAVGTPLDNTPPSAPFSFEFDVDQHRVHLSWEANDAND